MGYCFSSLSKTLLLLQLYSFIVLLNLLKHINESNNWWIAITMAAYVFYSLDRASDRMQWYGIAYFANIRIRLISIVPHKTKKLCHLSNKAASLQSQKQNFCSDLLFWRHFCPKTAMKKCQFVFVEFLTQAFDQRTWKLVFMELAGYKAADVLRTQLCIMHKKWAKMPIGLTLLSEGLAGFWLCDYLDSLLPISRWITVGGHWKRVSCHGDRIFYSHVCVSCWTISLTSSVISFAYLTHFSNLDISGTNADICKW